MLVLKDIELQSKDPLASHTSKPDNHIDLSKNENSAYCGGKKQLPLHSLLIHILISDEDEKLERNLRQ
jgi:hypothetical protein